MPGRNGVEFFFREKLMGADESMGSGKRFVIRLVGVDPGTRTEELASALQQLYRKKTLEELAELLRRLPLLLASSATEVQARKVHAFLKPKGAVLKITSVTQARTPVTGTSHGENVSVEKRRALLDQTGLNWESMLGEERRTKPRIGSGIQIHPMAIGELLDRSFRLLRQHFWLFFIVMFIPQGLFFVIEHGARLAFTAPSGGSLGLGVFTVFAFLAAVMVHFWAQGALIFAVSETYLGHSTSIKESYKAIRKRLGQLLGTMSLFWVMVLIWLALAGIITAVLMPVLAAVGIGGAVLIVLSVIAFIVTFWISLHLFLNWLLVDKVVVLENMGWMTALRRSKDLMNARTEPGFWRRPKNKAALIILLGILIGIGIHLLFQAPGLVFNLFAPESLLGSTVMGLLNIISTSLAAGYTAIAMILFYYDIRVRREGFDLKMMAQNL
jgi:hypothetical protein